MRAPISILTGLLALWLHLAAAPLAGGEEPPLRAGMGQADITPAYPVRLSGFGFRRAESEGVSQKIWAKALALDAGGKSLTIVIATDNLGVPDGLVEELAGRLKTRLGLERSRLAVTATHTHSAPMLEGVCPTLFGTPIPPDHQASIRKYTREFLDRLESAAAAAAADLRPARVEFGIGSVGFAANRRAGGGPVDHDLPILVVREAGPADGAIRGIYFSYACHCVTLSHNLVSGDWAGYAQELVQANHPGCIALASVGCGADSNPDSGVTGAGVEVARKQGAQIASEVDRLLRTPLTLLAEAPGARRDRIELALDALPPRAQWEERAGRQDAIGHHARVQIERLDRGEALQRSVSYPIQTWTFGERLALVFLPGEVVVDYSLRLKRELDRSRLWINAYANDAPCYIPSERVLKEGGYEGGDAMIYYDRPVRFAPGLEARIIDAVRAQIPAAFEAPRGTEGTRPKSAQDSLRSIQARDGLEVELAAAEPQVDSPVAIDWRADGKLLVAEMIDYPLGIDNRWKAGGRVSLLEDADGDGRYERASVFLEGLPFPTGVLAWGRGALICAAPDIILAEDLDGDGKAEAVRKLYTGFHTDNYQARVNGLSLGLDNWIHGANGLLGGTIHSAAGGKDLDIRGQDFRIRPETGAIEAVSGLTQQGLARDDWDGWFGCDNSTLLRHYPLPDRYLHRNPAVVAPDPAVLAAAGDDPNRLYPASKTLLRFNDPTHTNRVTSACGLGIYRDRLLGDGYAGNAFVCEPVHNLVHRLVLTPEGPTFSGRRAAGEERSEFLASTDNWFRPVQARAGPDGALWIVDMYRFLIEHPRWIQPDRLAMIDVRAGAGMGRIYRVRPRGAKLRAVPDLTRGNAAELAGLLDSPSGAQRDRVHLEILRRRDGAAAGPLAGLARSAELPEVRAQALCALDGIGALSGEQLLRSLGDPHPGVRALAIRLGESRLDGPPVESLAAMAADADPRVRFQLALSLGERREPRAGEALGRLAREGLEDPWMRAAVSSSAAPHAAALLSELTRLEESAARNDLIGRLIATAASGAGAGGSGLAGALQAILPPPGAKTAAWQLAAAAGLLEALEHAGTGPRAAADAAASSPALRGGLQALASEARRLAADASAAEEIRRAAAGLLGRGLDGPGEADLPILAGLLEPEIPPGLRAAAAAALGRLQSPEVAGLLLRNWRSRPPTARHEIALLLSSRDGWLAALLAAVEAGDVQPGEIPAAGRQRLLENASADVRRRAAEALRQPAAEDRGKAIERLRAALAVAGDPSRGMDVFSRRCASCHFLKGQGFEVGPDLAALQDKDAEYWVKNIADPGAAIEPRFLSYLVSLKNGRLITGIIRGETAASLTIVQSGGIQEKLLRSAIREIRAASVSLMPESLAEEVSPAEMADLLAFLRSGAARKIQPGNQPALARQDGEGFILLEAAAAEIYGGEIAFEEPFRNIGMWHGQGDQAWWTAEVEKPGAFDVYLDFACHPGSEGNAFLLASGEQALRGRIRTTGGWDSYRREKIGSWTIPGGRQRIAFRPDGPLRGALVDLRSICLAPTGKAPPGKTPAGKTPPGNLPSGLNADAPSAAPPPGDPRALALYLASPATPEADRQAALQRPENQTAALIAALAADLEPSGGTEEYRRIPWIWRLAIAAARRDAEREADAEMGRMLEVSLPSRDGALRHWQAVVLGGGLINGWSAAGRSPAQRLEKLLASREALRPAWKRALDLASAMADDAAVPSGTRYDALRILGAETWEKRGAQLVRYLEKKAGDELQMGAISALADLATPQAAAALREHLRDFSDSNRRMAEEALRKIPGRE